MKIILTYAMLNVILQLIRVGGAVKQNMFAEGCSQDYLVGFELMIFWLAGGCLTIRPPRLDLVFSTYCQA